MRGFKLDRSYYMAKDGVPTEYPELGLTLVSYEAAGAPYGQAFLGKQAKPVWHYRFRTPEAREAKFTEQLERAKSAVAYKAEKAAKKAAFQPSLKVGDLLVSSWGYDQTNVDYYEVVWAKGKMVDIRKVAQNSTETGYLSGQCSPKKGAYVGPVMRKRVQEGNTVKVRDWGAYAHPCGEKDSRYWSSYA